MIIRSGSFQHHTNGNFRKVVTQPGLNSIDTISWSSLRSISDPYIQLCKPRIVVMVVVVTALGFLLAGGSPISGFETLFWTVIGTVMTGGGASVLNQYLERDSDALMARTCKRPIPAGLITPEVALYFGILLCLAGVTALVLMVNLLTGFLGLLTAFLYVLVYTPLKKITWMNTLVGAIPGALPPVGGWTAVTGNIDGGAIALFLILFIWQMPHFYAIAWMYKEDYAKGGFKMLPVVDPTNKQTFFQIILFCHILILVSLLPTWLGLTGSLYLVIAVSAGGYFLVRGLEFVCNATRLNARGVVLASLVYLPALLFAATLDSSF